MIFRRWITATAMVSQSLAPALAQTAAPPPVVTAPPSVDTAKLPSLHIRCDGNPPHMSGGESFARFLGAVTLLGIFAPRPEAPDPGKRLFGDAGIAACSELIDGPHPDTNGLRRLQLILARAIHRMEVKDYQAAIADVDKARAEAKALKLLGNPYFDQSFGLSFDLIGAQATFLAGDAAGAREIGLRTASRSNFGFFPMVAGVSFAYALRNTSPAEDAALAARDRIMPMFVQAHAMRLEEVGRFAEAARLRDALATKDRNLNSESPMSWLQATAALDWALAGDFERGDAHVALARAGIDAGDAEGKPDPSRAGVIESLDLYAVLKAAHDGHGDDARRLFGARSEWTAVSFGVTTGTNALLRAGAKPDQLTGALALTVDDMWQAREEKLKAQFLKQIADGRREFTNILPFARVDEYEKTSRKVWKGDRTGVISDTPRKNSRFYTLQPHELEPIFRVVAPDSLLLDAAIIAKARGFKGFVYVGSNMVWSDTWVEFGNPGEPDMVDPFYIDADAVIAELRQLIPSPAELEAREKAVKS